MGIKNNAIAFAEKKGINLSDVQKSHLSSIEFRYKESDEEKDDIVEEVSDELKKAGWYLKDYEKKDLKDKLF